MKTIVRILAFVCVLGCSAGGQSVSAPPFVSSPRREFTAPELRDASDEWIDRSLQWADYILKKFAPAIPEPPERRAALIRLDDILHIESAPAKPLVQAFYKHRIEDAVAEMETTPVKDGVRIWKLYNHGFVVRTPTVTFAFDLVAGIPVEGFVISAALQQRLVDQCDALFISHEHGDHASRELAALFLKAGKPVVAPDGLWADDPLFAGHIVYPPRSLTETYSLPVRQGSQHLTVQAWPGHQIPVLNNIHMVTSPEGFTVLHTGDQETPEEPGTDYAWIDHIGEHHHVDVLLPNCWVTDLKRVIRGVNPDLVLTGHENEMQHTVDHREDYTQTYNRLFGTTYRYMVLGWGESVSIPFTRTASIQDKNFYVLSLLESSGEARRILSADPLLQAILKEKRSQPRLSTKEIAQVAALFDSLYQTSLEIRRLVDGPLAASGDYQLSGKNRASLLSNAWKNAAEGLDHLIDVYTGVTPPVFPDIDSPFEDPASDHYRSLVRLAMKTAADGLPGKPLFFEPSLQFGLALLDLNGFDNAVRLEPLATGENRAAIEHASTVQWKDYPYSAIVVPGAALPMRRLRVALAAKRYQQGLAPFLIVSGGAVRPARTTVIEAIEMKHQLMEEFGIPESAILVDPHARHTTTNLRNAAREIFRYGFPTDKEMLVTTDPDHSQTIEAEAFQERCRKELGYSPVTVKRRVSEFDLAVTPAIESLQINPLDPLDP